MKRVGLVSAIVALAINGLGVIVPNAQAATGPCVWTGAGGDNKFSTAGNWTSCSGSYPQAGDGIEFDTLLSSDVALTNDLGVDLGMVSVVAQPYVSGKNGVYNIDTLSLQDGAFISIQQASVCRYSYPELGLATLTGKGALSIDQRAFYGGNSPLVTVNGALTLTSGYGYNVFTQGSSADSIVLASPAAVTSATDCGGMGGGAAGAVDNLANFTYNSLTVQKGALVELMNVTKPITFGGGTGSNPTIQFTPNVDGDYNPVTTSYTWSGPVTLLSNTDVYVGSKTTVNYTGAITGSGLSLTKTVYSSGTFKFNPSSNNTSSQTGTQLNAEKTTKLEGTTTDYVSVVDRETSILSGVRGSASVYPGGTLKGSGTLTGGLYVDDGGVVAPGNSPGCLTADTISLNGTYLFELGGADACTGYDQIVVKNASNTNGAAIINGSSAVLTTSRYNNYTPKQGDVFVIISQEGDKAVSGTFMGLPEGATFTQNGIVFKISYVGGDGNDVTLTVQNSPTAPDTGVQILKSNPAVIAAATILAAVVLLGFAKRARQ